MARVAGDYGQAAAGRPRCWGLLDWFCKLWQVIARRPKGGDPCVYVPGRIINRPDPCIYSQFLLMQLDQPVTWDNPDVRIFRGGVEQDSYNLLADTAYDLAVTVHNSSRTKPALGTQVWIRWVEFGAGGQVKHPITTLPADVPVWPGTAVVNATWRTPATGPLLHRGRACTPGRRQPCKQPWLKQHAGACCQLSGGAAGQDLQPVPPGLPTRR